MLGVKLIDVEKRFGNAAVIHGVSMEIERGEFAVFVGPSGCGKSTLLRMIAGLEETSAGRIDIEGRDVTQEEPARRGVAMVFQSYALYPHLSVFENMAFSLRIARRPRAEVATRVGEAARILRLEEHLQKKPAQLSGGQRQRVAIGRAIVRQPKVFLFDEPLSNLDAELRVQMRLELARLHREIGATMIYVTHDQVEAMTLAHKIFVLRAGVVQQAGRPLEALRRPRQPLRRRLHRLAEHELPRRHGGGADRDRRHHRPGRHGRTSRRGAPARARPAAGTRVTLGMRPEHLEIAPDGAEGLPLTVDMEEDLGGVSYLHARTPSGQPIVLERRGDREQFEGRHITATVRPQQALVFDEAGAPRALSENRLNQNGRKMLVKNILKAAVTTAALLASAG